jgi:hypothetical protein
MAKYIDNDGVEWDVIGMSYAYLNKKHWFVGTTANGEEIKPCIDYTSCGSQRLILRKPKQVVDTPERAREWAKANPDVIVNNDTILRLAREYNYGDGLHYYSVQVELGKFIPLTEVEFTD